MSDPEQLPTEFQAVLRRVQQGDEVATTELWQRCFPRLLSYCRSKLPDDVRRVLDEEDVALSTFKSFCLRAQKGSLGEIEGRDELWKLLYTIASRKAQGYIRHQNRQKRGGGKVRGESVFEPQGTRSEGRGIEQSPDEHDSDATFAKFSHDCEVLLDRLDNETLQAIAVLRIEGYSVDEIAGRIGCARRSVERRLNLIRSIWQSELLP